jgi:hypothetical protein
MQPTEETPTTGETTPSETTPQEAAPAPGGKKGKKAKNGETTRTAAGVKVIAEPQEPAVPLKKGQRLTSAPKEGTLGRYMWDRIVEDRLDNETVLAMSLANFPESEGKISSVAWYRGQARKVLGEENVLTSKQATAEQAAIAKATAAEQDAPSN